MQSIYSWSWCFCYGNKINVLGTNNNDRIESLNVPASNNPWGTSNIILTCTMTTPKDWPCQNIDHTVTPKMLAPRARLSIYLKSYYYSLSGVFQGPCVCGKAESLVAPARGSNRCILLHEETFPCTAPMNKSKDYRLHTALTHMRKGFYLRF